MASNFNSKFAASTFQDFTDVTELYRSNSGTVYKGKFKFDGSWYVLKERRLAELSSSKVNTNPNTYH